MSEVIRGRQVRSLYQPIVHRPSGEIVGYEALARGPLDSPLERPDLLFAAAREHGQLAELDWLCRSTAFHGAIEARLDPPAALFVNVEPEVFDAPVPRSEAYRLSHAATTLKVFYEVTERGLVTRPAELLAEVERVRALGFGIAVDDVGADWHSLALLPFIRPDVVKLDMTLVQQPLTREGRAVASAVAAYAAESGAQILAEGIETEEHEARADALGATLGQGWRYGRPGPLPEGGAPTLRRGAQLVINSRPIERETPAEIALSNAEAAVGSRAMLVELSIAIERRALAAAEPCVVLGSFQTRDRFLHEPTCRRYVDLAAREAFVAAFGIDMPADPAPGVRGAALGANDRLADEWHIIVVGPHHAEALIARDLGDDQHFEFLYTADRSLIIRTARSLMHTIAPLPAAAPAAERYAA